MNLELWNESQISINLKNLFGNLVLGDIFTYSTYSHFIFKVLWCHIQRVFDCNEIMQKNKTEWKVKLALKLFVPDKKNNEGTKAKKKYGLECGTLHLEDTK